VTSTEGCVGEGRSNGMGSVLPSTQSPPRTQKVPEQWAVRRGADAGGRERGGAEAKASDPSPAACPNERGQLELFGDDGRAWRSQGESMFRIRIIDARSLSIPALFSRCARPPTRLPISSAGRYVTLGARRESIAEEDGDSKRGASGAATVRREQNHVAPGEGVETCYQLNSQQCAIYPSCHYSLSRLVGGAGSLGTERDCCPVYPCRLV
jgi:hypothetical protein